MFIDRNDLPKLPLSGCLYLHYGISFRPSAAKDIPPNRDQSSFHCIPFPATLVHGCLPIGKGRAVRQFTPLMNAFAQRRSFAALGSVTVMLRLRSKLVFKPFAAKDQRRSTVREAQFRWEAISGIVPPKYSDHSVMIKVDQLLLRRVVAWPTTAHAAGRSIFLI
jgi:hypothetical protein